MNTEGLRATHRFSKTVSEATNSSLNFSYKYYENEDHGTIIQRMQMDTILCPIIINPKMIFKMLFLL